MQLNKTQIKYIDNYLKHHQVKYWDIRIDLLDHIVSSVEDKMSQGLSFDKALIEVHKSFGNKMTRFWNSGTEYSIFANGSGYKKFITQKTREINKKYKKIYFRGFISLFKSFKTLTLVFLLIFLDYSISNYVSSKFFIKINLVLLTIPLIIFLPLYLIQGFKKNNSINALYILSYSHFQYAFLYFLLFIFKAKFFIVNPIILSIAIPLMAILNLMYTYSSYNIYKIAIKEFNNLHKKYKIVCR